MMWCVSSVCECATCEHNKWGFVRLAARAPPNLLKEVVSRVVELVPQQFVSAVLFDHFYGYCVRFVVHVVWLTLEFYKHLLVHICYGCLTNMLPSILGFLCLHHFRNV